ncbi:MAG TPA: hypothetical protein VLS48_00145 [Anaerolineales bacterium]|nr:hypothetical protein [Anaerolineales bacterium]
MAQAPETGTTQRTLWIILGIIGGLCLLCACLAFAGLLLFNVNVEGTINTPFPPQVVTAPAFPLDTPVAPTMIPETAAPPAAPTAQGNVRINAFTVDPDRINAGQCATLSWTVQNADDVVLLRDEEPIFTNAGLEDEFQDCRSQPGIYRYRLEAGNQSGSTNFLELQLIVDR